MALTKTETVDKVEILGRVVQVRKKITVHDDGVLVASTNHREVLTEGDDVSSQPAIVRDVCALVWG